MFTRSAPVDSDRRFFFSVQGLIAAGPPARFQTTDLNALFDGGGECLQLSRGEFHCHGVRATAPGVRFTELELNCGVQLRFSVKNDRLVLLVLKSPANGRAFSHGVGCDRETCIVVGGQELSLNILGAALLRCFDIDRNALDCGTAPPVTIRGVLKTNRMEQITLQKYAAALFRNDGTLWLRPSIDESLRRVASALFLRATRSSETRASANRERLVRRAEELMWASIEEPPTLRDICKGAQCSVRTLIYAFNASFGMSPMKYFKIQRLNAAHRKFRHSPAGTHVFDVAADCGFWHLGHFGVDYKAFFGTTPKMTVRPYQPEPAFGAGKGPRSYGPQWT